MPSTSTLAVEVARTDTSPSASTVLSSIFARTVPSYVLSAKVSATETLSEAYAEPEMLTAALRTKVSVTEVSLAVTMRLPGVITVLPKNQRFGDGSDSGWSPSPRPPRQ